MSVTFDGPNKLIIADTGTTQLDVSKDLYSAWKDWTTIGDNIKYDPAFRVVGGDPTVGGNQISGYFFLMNGWKVRPQEADHSLTVDGILLVDGGGDPFVNTLGTYNVRINMITPLQAETITVVSGSGVTEQDKVDIIEGVWDSLIETGYTAQQTQRIMLSALAGKLSGAGGTSVVIRDINDSKDRIEATVDQQGNRIAVTLDGN